MGFSMFQLVIIPIIVVIYGYNTNISACFVLLLLFFCLPHPMWKSSKPMGCAALSAVHEQCICFQGGCGCGAVPPLFVGGIVAHPALQSVRC